MQCMLHLDCTRFKEEVSPLSDPLNTVDTRLGELISVIFMMNNPESELSPAYVAVSI